MYVLVLALLNLTANILELVDWSLSMNEFVVIYQRARFYLDAIASASVIFDGIKFNVKVSGEIHHQTLRMQKQSQMSSAKTTAPAEPKKQATRS